MALDQPIVGQCKVPTEISGPPILLKISVWAILVFPPYMVVESIGASSSVSQLLAMLLMLLWLAACLFGLHKPYRNGHPGRASLILWVLASCAAYVSMYAGMSGNNDAIGRAAADRWMLLVFAGAGLTLTITDAVRNRFDLLSVVRWLLAGAAFCSVIAIIQFFAVTNPMDVVTANMLGFTNNGSGTTFQPRGSFTRVAGTTMHPIELGVVCSMLLPLAVWRALFDSRGSVWGRWMVVALIAVGNLVTVSRSGMLGLSLAVLAMMPFLPKFARRWTLVIIPPALIGVFLFIPGMVTTLFETASAGSSDSSITYRTDDYPLALHQVGLHPILGKGPGNWMPTNAKDIFDNQYLLTAVTMGIIGLVALVLYLVTPMLAVWKVALCTKDDSLRCFAGAVGAALLAAVAGTGTFDSMSFQVFALIVPVFIGFSGVAWKFTRENISCKA